MISELLNVVLTIVLIVTCFIIYIFRKNAGYSFKKGNEIEVCDKNEIAHYPCLASAFVGGNFVAVVLDPVDSKVKLWVETLTKSEIIPILTNKI